MRITFHPKHPFALLLLVALCLCGCREKPDVGHNGGAGESPAAGSVHPALWPEVRSAVPRNEALEARVAGLLGRMTLEEKVGQIIQAEIGSVTPQQVQEFHLGSVLNGGGSFPSGNKHATVADWVALADAFYKASTNTSDGYLGIPVLWGSDAVHGHNNVLGATIFPHNIGLGAADDPQLIRRIGEITAREVAATGLDWTFAPTLAVVRDDRWGRSYESYAETPERIASYAKQVVEGVQGVYGQPDFLSGDHLLANAKHFLGDGGTFEGRDQGDNRASEQVLRDIHAPGYVAALEAGAQIVMASFSSWQGIKMHGHKGLLTDVLKGRMGFDGFVISDWNAHSQIPGCTLESCPAAINAGIDMIMVPQDWQAFYRNTLAQVRAGEIGMERLNDAVTRILRVKARAGLLDKPKPSTRPLAGKAELLGAPEHRAVAREAVRKSLVLLKNNNRLLPLDPRKKYLVLGDGADNIGKQSGGWTLTWQGTGNSNSDFPNGDSIYEGIAGAVAAAGGEVSLAADGKLPLPWREGQKPDVAIMVYGEDPYAEFQGDRKNLLYVDKSGAELPLLKALRAQDIDVVSVFLSGRPLWVNPYLNNSDAFVAAWLPGSEGAGVADVLFARPDGSVHYDFTGRLTFSWPKTAVQYRLNSDSEPYDPLFAAGYGLRYADSGNLPLLAEESGLREGETVENTGVYFAEGRVQAPWQIYLGDESGTEVVVSGQETLSGSQVLSARLTDRHKQGDSRRFAWSGAGRGTVALRSELGQNIARESNGGLLLALQLRLESEPEDDVFFAMNCGDNCAARLPVQRYLAGLPQGEWKTLRLPLSCFAAAGAPMEAVDNILTIGTSGALVLSVSDIRLVSAGEGGEICPEMAFIDN